ncbi:MAG: YnbE family lipoprotein [Alphaproteobacteria bacterium]
MTRIAPLALSGPAFAASARHVLAAGGLLAAGAVAACNPTVRVEGPREPITINLNVKVDADIRVKLEEQADQDVEKQDDIF